MAALRTNFYIRVDLCMMKVFSFTKIEKERFKKVLIKSNIYENDVIFKELSENKNKLCVLIWLKEQDLLLETENTFSTATSCNNLDFVMYLRSIRCPCDEQATFWAIAKGHLQMVQWLVANDFPIDRHGMIPIAVKYGQLEIAKWLRSQNFPWGNAIHEAIAREDSVMIEWMTS